MNVSISVSPHCGVVTLLHSNATYQTLPSPSLHNYRNQTQTGLWCGSRSVSCPVDSSDIFSLIC